MNNIENNFKTNYKSLVSMSYINNKKSITTSPNNMICNNRSMDDPQDIVSAFTVFVKLHLLNHLHS